MKSNRFVQWVKRGAVGVGALYLSAYLAVYFLQDRLTFSGHASQGAAEAQVQSVKGAELLRLKTVTGESVAALFGPATDADGATLADAAKRPTLLFFYGTGGYLARSFVQKQFAALRRGGCNVLIPDYVGYGMSQGNPSESGLYATADAAYEHLLTRPDVDPTKIIAVGHSLGGAPAIDLAARKPVAALATFATFTSLDDMAHERYPYFPTWIGMKNHCRNLEKIGRVKCPIVIVHAKSDDVVPFSMADALAQAATAPVVRVTVEGGDHNHIFNEYESRALAGLREFVGKL
jgi:uncharacterized protein